MKYKIDKEVNYTIFELEEDNLNSVIAPSLKSEFVILKNEGIRNLILSLAPVKYVDSSGLSAILTANRLWSSSGIFVLTGINHESVKKLITISKLDSILKIIPTTKESIDFVFMEELQREIEAEILTEESYVQTTPCFQFHNGWRFWFWGIIHFCQLSKTLTCSYSRNF